MRLHPVDDGLIPLPDERGLRVRDRGGNNLVDVTDPKTGFCVGVRSNLTTRDGVSVFPASPVSGGSPSVGSDTRFDPEHEVYYDLIRSSDTDPVGLVVRTVADGDAPLRTTRVRVVTSGKSVSHEIAAKSTAPVRKNVSARKQNDEAVRAILSAHGYTGKITPVVRKLALELLAYEKHISGLVE